MKREIIGGKALKININQLPPEAWTILTGGDEEQGKKLYSLVSWMYRCAEIRASSVQTMPWQITRGREVVARHDDDETNPDLQWFIDKMPALLYQTARSTLTNGKAYWLKDTGNSCRWLLPSSIKHVVNEDTGEHTGFRRRRKGRDIPLDIEDVVYFWPPDEDVEVGPALNYPGKAASIPANVLNALDAFLKNYFDRGMIKATLLTYPTDTTLSVDDKRELKEWWKRVTNGVKNAFNSLVVRGDFKPVVIGEGIKELHDDVLTVSERRAIEVAFGLPETKLNQAANMATKIEDDKGYIMDTVKPHADWIASVINEQLLNALGYNLRYLPQELPVMQTDEHMRSQSLVNLVNAGMTLEAALLVLGYDLPDDVEVAAPPPPPPPVFMAPPMQDDGEDEEIDERQETEEKRLRRWASKRTNPDPMDFKSDVLSFGRIAEIVSDVKGWESPLDTERAFYATLARIDAAIENKPIVVNVNTHDGTDDTTNGTNTGGQPDRD